ncbi:unnamed protein product, partial [Strongylus vulgaris]
SKEEVLSRFCCAELGFWYISLLLWGDVETGWLWIIILLMRGWCKRDTNTIPFSWELPKELNGFISPQSVRFTLTPFMSAKRFACNLRSGEEWLFHFRVDFRNSNEKHSKDAVIRNSTRKGKWLDEERTISHFPFSKGLTCDILFTAYGSTVAVDVDGVHFVKFKYRVGDDPSLIDKITVQGDCILQRFVHRTYV